MRIINSKGREIIMIRPANKVAQPREDIVFRSSDSSISGRVPLTILLRLTFGLFWLILLMSVAQSGAAQGVKFTSPVTYPAGHPFVVTAGDFNRDGKLDLAISNSSPSTSISILFGKGDGSFGQPVTYPVVGSRLVVADLNRDGWPDLVERTGILPYNSSAVVLLNNGNGTFQDPKSYSLPQNSRL